MKKLKLLFLMGSVMSLAACGAEETTDNPVNPDNPPVQHNFGTEWSKDATNHWHGCTDSGCTEKKDVSAHTFGDWAVKTPATYDAAGVEARTCSVCGQEDTRAITKIEHNYANVWSKDASQHWHACTDEGFTSLKKDAANHTGGNWTVKNPATFDAAGVEAKSCTVCGQEMETRPITKLEHNYATIWSKDATNHWHACTDEGYTNLKKDEAAHTAGNWTVKTPATFDAAGVEAKSCTVCGQEMETRPIDKLVHNYSNVWSKDANEHWHACTDAGYTDLKKDEANHTAGNWEVKTPATYDAAGEEVKKCTVCGQELETRPISKFEHKYDNTWSSDANKHWHACIDTGFTSLKKDEADHTWGDPVFADGTNTYTCSVCEATKTERVPLVVNSVSLNNDSGVINWVISGASYDYETVDAFKADLKLELKKPGSVLLDESNIVVTDFTANGAFTAKIDITALDVYSNPYYSRFSVGTAKDFNYVDVANVNTIAVTTTDKSYKLVYDPTATGADKGYGTISILVSPVVAKAFNATSARLAVEDGKAMYIIEGTSEGFETSDEAISAITFQLKTSGANIARNNSDIVVANFTANGAFVFKCDVTSLAVNSGTAWYTNIGLNSAATKDFKPEAAGVEKGTIAVGTKSYTLIYGGSGADHGYGCVSIVVNEGFVALGASLEKVDDQVNYVITGMSFGYTTGSDLLDAITFQLKQSGSNVARTKSDLVVTVFVENGGFIIKCDITGIAATSTVPWYTNIGLNSATKKDFKPVEASFVDTTSVIETADKTYKLIYAVGSAAQGDGYGCVSVVVTNK